MKWTDDQIVFALIASMFFLIVIANLVTARRSTVWRERRQSYVDGVIKMANRRAFLDSRYADMINECLLKMWGDGEISWQEYLKDSRRLGLRTGLRDLLPINVHPRAIRKRVRYNCEQMHREMNGIQPRIPGPKPGEIVPSSPVIVVRRVVMGKRLT